MTNILWCHCTFCETDKLVAYAKHSCFAPVQQWCQGVGIRYAVEAAERRVHARIPKLLRISRVEADTDVWNSLLHEMNKYLFFDKFFFSFYFEWINFVSAQMSASYRLSVRKCFEQNAQDSIGVGSLALNAYIYLQEVFAAAAQHSIYRLSTISRCRKIQ